MDILKANRIASQLNGLSGDGNFSVQDGIDIANAAAEIFAKTWDVTKNKNSVNQSTTTPQIYYVQQPPTNQGYTQYSQQQDNTLMYVALAGLGILAVMFLTKKK